MNVAVRHGTGAKVACLVKSRLMNKTNEMIFYMLHIKPQDGAAPIVQVINTGVAAASSGTGLMEPKNSMSETNEKLFRVISWLDAEEIEPYEGKACAATTAHLVIQWGQTCFTKNEALDMNSGFWKPRNHIRVCLYPLALWLTENFHQILYEANEQGVPESDPSWDSSHNMAFAGDGFFWPPIIFRLEDHQSSLQVYLPKLDSTKHFSGSVRFCDTAKEFLPTETLKIEILEFLKTCFVRLEAEGIHHTDFQDAYKEILRELDDKEIFLF